MKKFSLGIIGAAAAASLVGCATAFAPTPQGGAVTAEARHVASRCSAPWISNGAAFRCRPNRAKSWMKPASGPLLYVSDIGAEAVDVLSYPSGKTVGALTGFYEPNGLCSDAKGDVFVTDAYAAEVEEFAHGGTKPIATLPTGGEPLGCAIDPTTGDLAVTFYTDPAQSGSVSVFKNASGTGTNYPALYRTFYCTYDGSGNLFVNGFNNGGFVSLGELAQGASKVITIETGWRAGWTGGLQWDGKYLALGDEFASKFEPSRALNAVYQVSVASGHASLVKTASLDGGEDVVQFWLAGKTLIGPDARTGDVDFFSYPAGGKAKKTIEGFDEPVGATLSK